MSALPSSRPRRVPALFTSSATTLFRVLLAAAALVFALSGTLAYAYFHSSYWNRIGMAPPQPILFSHRHHAGELRIDCRNCHPTVETAAFAGMPSTQTCLTCHSQIFTNTTMIRPLVQSAVLDIPLQWNRVNQLPAHVFFDHSIHVSKGVACVTCHGEIGTMALTVKGEPLTMRWCLDCHRNPGPRLSQRSELFEPVSPKWSRGPRPDLAAFYHVSVGSLTDCSTCHH